MRRNERRGSEWAVAALAVLALSLSTGCHHRGPVKAVSRASRAPVAGPLSTAVVAPGVVEPWGEEVRVAAKEAGWIAEIRVREGQRVEAGEVLARLDNGAQAAGLAAAAADVAELEALLRRARQGSTAEELAQARAERDAAAARAERAHSDAARSSRLMEEGLVARAEGERAVKDAEAEAAAAASLEARYAGVVRGTRPEDLAAAGRRLEAARARLQAARAALTRRVVAAPVAGTVLWSRYRAGELYAAGSQALFVLGDVSRLQVRVDVDEIDAQRVAVGAQATIRVEGSPEQAQGRVLSLSPRMGRKTCWSKRPRRETTRAYARCWWRRRPSEDSCPARASGSSLAPRARTEPRRARREVGVAARHGEADLYRGVQYGLGWHVVPEAGRLRVQHRGGGPGFGSEMRLYPLERRPLPATTASGSARHRCV